MFYRLLLLGVALSFFGESARAQQQPNLGAIVSPTVDIKAWNSSPDGLAGLLSRQVGHLDASQQFRVQNVRQVPTIAGKKVWVELKAIQQPANAAAVPDSCNKGTCWVELNKVQGAQMSLKNINPGN